MRKQFISPLLSSTHADEIIQLMEEAPELDRLTSEFCFAFNLNVYKVNGASAWLRTPNGLDIGYVKSFKRYNSSGNEEQAYMFNSSPIVQRERAARGHSGNHDVRDAKTIQGLIRAVKKNDAPITDEYLSQCYANTVRGSMAIPSENYNGNEPDPIYLKADAALALVESFLEIDRFAAQRAREAVEQAYTDFRNKNKKRNEALDTSLRFGEGVNVIMFEPGRQVSLEQREFLIGQLCVDTSENSDRNPYSNYDVKVMSQFKRVVGIPEEFGGTEVIIRAYMEGRGHGYAANNPFGIARYSDFYSEELDFVTEAHGLFNDQWQAVLLPMREHGQG